VGSILLAGVKVVSGSVLSRQHFSLDPGRPPEAATRDHVQDAEDAVSILAADSDGWRVHHRAVAPVAQPVGPCRELGLVGLAPISSPWLRLAAIRPEKEAARRILARHGTGGGKQDGTSVTNCSPIVRRRACVSGLPLRTERFEEASPAFLFREVGLFKIVMKL
jgi:hypothetical protein